MDGTRMNEREELEIWLADGPDIDEIIERFTQMDKYKLFFYELAKYTNALAENCDKWSVYLHIHGITDPWTESRETFNQLHEEIRDTLQRLRKESENE